MFATKRRQSLASFFKVTLNQKHMNIYKHKQSGLLYTLDRLILDIHRLDRNANAGIHATPYKHNGEYLHFLSKDAQECADYVLNTFDIVATTNPEKKKYIIVGDNNYWYAASGEITVAELQTLIKEVQENIANGDFQDQEAPKLLYVMEATELERINLE